MKKNSNSQSEETLKKKAFEKQYDRAQKNILSEAWLDAYMIKTLIKDFEQTPLEEIVGMLTKPEFLNEKELFPDSEAVFNEGRHLLPVDERGTELRLPEEGTNFNDLRISLIGKDGKRKAEIIIEIQGEITSNKQEFFNRINLYQSRVLSTESGIHATAKEQCKNLVPVYTFCIIIECSDYIQNTIVGPPEFPEKKAGMASDKNIDRFFKNDEYDLERCFFIFLGDAEVMKDKPEDGNKLLYLLDILLNGVNYYKLMLKVYKDILGVEPREKLKKELEEMGNSPGAVLVARIERQAKEALENLNRTKEELSTTQEELNTTQEELSTTQEELNTTQEELSTTQEELSTTQEKLSTTQEKLNLSEKKAAISKEEGLKEGLIEGITQSVRELINKKVSTSVPTALDLLGVTAEKTRNAVINSLNS